MQKCVLFLPVAVCPDSHPHFHQFTVSHGGVCERIVSETGLQETDLRSYESIFKNTVSLLFLSECLRSAEAW